MQSPEHGSGPTIASLIIDNATAYAIFTLDSSGRILTWSRGAEMIFGYTPQEAVELDFAQLFTVADRVAGAHMRELDQAERNGRAEDTRWHVRKDGEPFWANGMTMRIDAPGPETFVKIMRDETGAKLAEDQRILLLNELNHRIKNTLATVQAITEQTLRAREVEPTVRKELTDRLLALSEAHDILVQESWAGADLGAVMRSALGGHQTNGDARLTVEGPPVRLSPNQAVAVSLALHELATNAVKYGALSVPEGRVSITWNERWNVDGSRHMTLVWRELGGPVVEAPSRAGFGTRLIARTFGAESGGVARLEFPPEGVHCVIELPLSTQAEAPLRL